MNYNRPFNSGRNGADELSVTLIVAGILILLAAPIFTLTYLKVIVVVAGGILIALAVMRALSTNVGKRRAENDRFTSFFSRKGSVERRREREEKKARKAKRKENEKIYAYFFCPKCKKELRVPRGRGKIKITCPNCSEQFIRKT